MSAAVAAAATTMSLSQRGCLTAPAGSMAGFVLHVDIDAFFCQAEQLRDPSLQASLGLACRLDCLVLSPRPAALTAQIDVCLVNPPLACLLRAGQAHRGATAPGYHCGQPCGQVRRRRQTHAPCRGASDEGSGQLSWIHATPWQGSLLQGIAATDAPLTAAAQHVMLSQQAVRPPPQARRLLAAVGGRVVHVHLAEGGRVSYQPYRWARSSGGCNSKATSVAAGQPPHVHGHLARRIPSRARAHLLICARALRPGIIHLPAGPVCCALPCECARRFCTTVFRCRELSARLLRLLRAQPWAAVVEKASIDEAFVLIKQANPGAATASTAAAEPCCDDDALGWDAGDCGGLGLAGAAQAALQRAREVKAAGEAYPQPFPCGTLLCTSRYANICGARTFAHLAAAPAAQPSTAGMPSPAPSLQCCGSWAWLCRWVRPPTG